MSIGVGQKKGAGISRIARKREYPPYIYTLLYLFVLYMTLPIIEIPLLGLSVSAPLIFIIALQVFFRSPNLQMNKYSKWIFLVFLIWAGIFLSATLNGFLTGGIRVDVSTGVALLQYAYWFLTFVLIVYLFSSDKQLFDKSAELIALGIGILGVLRFGEAIFGGATGAWMRLRVMSENGYGIQFSMFYPVLLTFLYVKENRKWTILVHSSEGYWAAKFFKKYECGLVVDGGKEDIWDATQSIKNASQLRARMIKNSKEALAYFDGRKNAEVFRSILVS